MENVRSTSPYDPLAKIPEAQVPATTTKALDSPAMLERFKKFIAYRKDAQEWFASNRLQQSIDQDFYDGIQWSAEDRYTLEVERGQPALVFNIIAPAIRWLTGSEKRVRVDFVIKPRKGKEYNKIADGKTHLLKFVDDCNRARFIRSKAFADAVTAGVGWQEIGITDNPDREMVTRKHESWRNVWYDPMSKEDDLSDARYLFREKWVDVDTAVLMFPDRKTEIIRAAENQDQLYGQNNDAYGGINEEMLPNGSADSDDYRGLGYGQSVQLSGKQENRERLKLIEFWYRNPESVDIIKDPDKPWNGAVVTDDLDPVLEFALEQGAEVVQAIRMVVRLSVFTEDSMLWDGPSGFWHNQFPLIPTWCYKRGRDNMPYGVVRGLRDPQEDLNKRRSKALHILSTNQIEMEEAAVDDLDELRDEADRPDGVIIRKAGKELKINRDRALASQHIDLMTQDEHYIQSTSGITDELMGRQTNAVSGKAIQERAGQGIATTADIFDMLSLSDQLVGEQELSLIEQFYDTEKTIRIIGNTGRSEFLQFNGYDEDGNPYNDLTETKSDFVVDVQDHRATIRQAMAEQLMEMMNKLPGEIALKLLDVVVDMSDVPQKETLVSRIRQINGMEDPLADDEDPEIQQRKQAEAEQQQREQELAMREAEAQVSKLESEGDKLDAQTMLERVKAIQEAMTAAASTIVAPDVVPVAKALMQGETNRAGRIAPNVNQPLPSPGGLQ